MSQSIKFIVFTALTILITVQGMFKISSFTFLFLLNVYLIKFKPVFLFLFPFYKQWVVGSNSKGDINKVKKCFCDFSSKKKTHDKSQFILFDEKNYLVSNNNLLH